jgi:ribonuclease P protein component
VHAFPRTARLFERHDFSRVFDRPEIKASSHCFLLLATARSHGAARLGVVVGKKHIRKACRRNRIKRLVREHFRTHRPAFPLDIVIIARGQADQKDNVGIRRELAAMWDQLARAVPCAG